jgi:serine protease Do
MGVAAAVSLFPGGIGGPRVARAAADPLSEEVQGIFNRDAGAVVKIEAEDDSGPLSGTGFFVDPNGTIFTNYSVGGDSHNIVISFGPSRYTADRVAADPRSGLAILKLEAQNMPKTPFLPLGKASELGVASLVMTIGYPLDLPITPNIGCVAGFGISYGNRYFAVAHIRANVPAQRGEGGAPLLNMEGEVVGILESSLDGGAGCFALPIEAAEKVQSDVVRFGEVHPGWLGIRFDNSGTPGNIEIQGFVPNSPAAKAGLQPGDLILQVGDRKVATPEDVLNAAFYLTAGEEVPLTVSRSGQTMEIKVVPGLNPLAPENEAVPARNLSEASRGGDPLAPGNEAMPGPVFSFSFVTGSGVFQSR